jgi:hypothetical protein
VSTWDEVATFGESEWDEVADFSLVTPRVIKSQKDTELAEMVAKARKLGIPEEELQSFFNPPDATEGMSSYEKYLAGVGQSLTKSGRGMEQMMRHLTPGMETDALDEKIREQVRLDETGGLNKSAEAGFGGLVTDVAPYAAGGGALMKMGPIKAGLAEAGLETATTPTTGDSFAKEKALQGAGNVALATGINKGIDMGAGMLERAVNAPHALADMMERPARGEPMFRGTAADIAEGNRIADSTGIRLSPAQRSQATGSKQMEELARGSIWSGGKVKAGDEARSGDLERALNQYVDSLGSNAPREVVAGKVQSWVDDHARTLIKNRKEQADIDYAPIKTFAGGAPVIPADNYRRTLEKIISDGKAASAGADARSAADEAVTKLQMLDDQGGMLTGKDIDMLTRAADKTYGGTVFEVSERGYGDRLARELRKAVEADIEPLKTTGLTEQLELAKKNYTEASDEIAFLKQSGLGKIVGEELASDITQLRTNTVSPMKVFNNLWKQDPVDLKVTLDYLKQHDPELANELIGSYVSQAVEAGKIGPASAGSGDSLNPTGFLQALGMTGGTKNRALNRERINILLEGTPAEGFMRDTIEAATRMSDTTGKNFSGTAAMMEARDAADILTGLYTSGLAGLKKIIGSLSTPIALRGYADRMNPNSPRYLTGGDRYQVNPLTKQRVTTLPAIPALIAAGEARE